MSAPGCSFTSSVGRLKPKNTTLLSFNAHGLPKNIPELTKCISEYGIDIALIQEKFLKPSRPTACAIAGYIQLRTDRTHGRNGGTVVYYKRSLHCCPIDIPPLINMEATGYRLAMTGHGTLVIVSVYLPSLRKLVRRDLRALLALGDAVIFFGDFNCKNTRWGCPFNNYNGDKLNRLEDKLNFEIIAPFTSTYFPNIVTNRPSTLDIALTKGVVLNFNYIETLHGLLSDHRPVMGPPDGGVLTKHIRTVVGKSERDVPTSSDRRRLPPNILESIKAKNAALRHASEYPTPEYRSRARAFQHEVRTRVQEFRNENWSDLVQEITATHKAFCKVTKALKTEEYIPALKRPDNSVALDDAEIAECLADSIESQCSHASSPHDIVHINHIEEEIQNIASLEPKDDLPRVSLSEFHTLMKSLNTRKAPGLDGISNKAINCFSLPLLGLLVAIYNACLENYYFPLAWKEAEIRAHLCSNETSSHSDTTRRLIRAGVSQGSCLSFLLYSAYTNDIPRASSERGSKPCSVGTANYVGAISALSTKCALGGENLRASSLRSRRSESTRLQVIHNKFSRAATDAHRCVRNSVLHRDLELPTISKYMKDASKRFFDIAGSHPNALLRATVNYEPPHFRHFIRRPRNVLNDPPDVLTAAVESYRTQRYA
ncbi:RNA-directed DNA polymerase from mobile element jockey [Eumeta japonica]|uniref:RNA-directed DNA polymerase from mobile element jockey n=1 Tax=Eumeta variegata TaxID=151549 RepID=A0A4C1TK39_EUMVA|nr:RNA-directed DNA polymerase from mobile element jockey [Eumeta japonica]